MVLPRPFRTDQPHSARMYDYLLGGTDNFPPDRDAAERALVGFPHLRITARQNRAFMTRAVRHLAAEVGIRQFLDIGTGIPTSPPKYRVQGQLFSQYRASCPAESPPPGGGSS